jgi:hypothetical protein
MIVARKTILDFLKHSKIAGYGYSEQPEAAAKYLANKQTGLSDRFEDMVTMVLPNGDIAVRPLPKYRREALI